MSIVCVSKLAEGNCRRLKRVISQNIGSSVEKKKVEEKEMLIVHVMKGANDLLKKGETDV